MEKLKHKFKKSLKNFKEVWLESYDRGQFIISIVNQQIETNKKNKKDYNKSISFFDSVKFGSSLFFGNFKILLLVVLIIIIIIIVRWLI